MADAKVEMYRRKKEQAKLAVRCVWTHRGRF
jgi:hypothetical protein